MVFLKATVILTSMLRIKKLKNETSHKQLIRNNKGSKKELKVPEEINDRELNNQTQNSNITHNLELPIIELDEDNQTFSSITNSSSECQEFISPVEIHHPKKSHSAAQFDVKPNSSQPKMKKMRSLMRSKGSKKLQST